jgi:HPt (histidine-containing phosphotransfer) domain-containing protein/CheY-like chemotaxis protein
MNAILDGMRGEFLADCKDKLDSVQEIVEQISDPGTDYDAALMEIKRQIHSIKGTGGTFGFPSITHIAHAFEDHIETTGNQNKIGPDVINQFLDPICQILDGGVNPNENDTRAILDTLPNQQTADSGIVIESAKNAVLAMPKDLWRKIAAQELVSIGYNVALADTVMSAIDRGLILKPELIVIGMQLDRTTGLELAGAFGQFDNTRNAKIVILSSSSKTDPGKISHLKNTAVIFKGPHFSCEIRSFLDSPPIIHS